MKATRNRTRFSLRDLMILIVLLGIHLAGKRSEGSNGSAAEIINFCYSILECSLLGTMFAYRGLSRWMWVSIASMILPSLVKLVGLGVYFDIFYPLNGWPKWPGVFFSLFVPTLLYLGLALVFHDVKNQLRSHHDRLRTHDPDAGEPGPPPPLPVAP